MYAILHIKHPWNSFKHNNDILALSQIFLVKMWQFYSLFAWFAIISTIIMWFQTMIQLSNSNLVLLLLLCSGFAGYIQFIPHARVPVLQYVSNRYGISCDISINNFAGRIKSKIFYWVNTLDERFGDMVLLVWI